MIGEFLESKVHFARFETIEGYSGDVRTTNICYFKNGYNQREREDTEIRINLSNAGIIKTIEMIFRFSCIGQKKLYRHLSRLTRLYTILTINLLLPGYLIFAFRLFLETRNFEMLNSGLFIYIRS